jgi:hypothetical protein
LELILLHFKLFFEIKFWNWQNRNRSFFIFRFKRIISWLHDKWIDKCKFYGCLLNVFITIFNDLYLYFSVPRFQCFQNKIVSLILNLIFVLMYMSSYLRWILPSNSSKILISRDYKPLESKSIQTTKHIPFYIVSKSLKINLIPCAYLSESCKNFNSIYFCNFYLGS